MQDIHIHRYEDPDGVGWAGYIEPEDQTWILFIDLDNKPAALFERDPETGAVIEPEE